MIMMKKYMAIKFDTDDKLPLSKKRKVPIIKCGR